MRASAAITEVVNTCAQRARRCAGERCAVLWLGAHGYAGARVCSSPADVTAQINGEWRFDFYTPDELMAFSSVPPFKMYFSVPLDGRAAKERTVRSKRIHLTKARLARMREHFDELRKLED